MNGNILREGDLVMVLLEKPALVGFINKINTPSILTNRDKNPIGTMTVAGTITLPFDPSKINILRQTAKLVDPNSETLINAIMSGAKNAKAAALTPLPSAADLDAVEKEKEAVEKTGPSLVPSAPLADSKTTPESAA
jgi:hypothetical protein